MLADDVRVAYERRDLDAFSSLLAEDVTWGEPGFPGSCSDRGDVLATLRRLIETGATGEVVSASDFPGGVVVQLRTPASERWQALLVRGGRIAEIRGYDDAESAEEAVRGE